MAERIGFIVMDKAEEWEQGLRLLHGEALPPGGILDWRGNTDAVAVFPDRASARAAITRTEHYRLAYRNEQLPRREFCKVVPVARVQVETSAHD